MNYMFLASRKRCWQIALSCVVVIVLALLMGRLVIVTLMPSEQPTQLLGTRQVVLFATHTVQNNYEDYLTRQMHTTSLSYLNTSEIFDVTIIDSVVKSFVTYDMQRVDVEEEVFAWREGLVPYNSPHTG